MTGKIREVREEEIIMDKLESDFNFKFMSLSFKIRDLFLPPKNLLKEVGIKPGFYVLDYGCGPGSYITPTAELVGKSGKIYALDIRPMAIQMVQNINAKKKLTNVETILSDCKTELPDNIINVVLLYDIFHDLSEPTKILEELHRVLKPDGILSFNDHHIKEDEIVLQVTRGGLFRLSQKGKRTYSFLKVG